MTAYLEQNQDQTLIVLTDVFGEVWQIYLPIIY